jgi:hypothetical protein
MKQFRLLAGIGILAGVLTSCAPETIPADSDGNPDGKYTINYGVQVIPVGNVDRGQVDASVTIQTQNGVTTKTVGPDGIAVFEGLNAGTISGYVSANGYAAVNFKAYCAPNNVDVNSNGYVSSTVYIPAMNSGVNGRLYGDFNQDGNTTLTDPGNFQVIDMFIKYNVSPSYPMGTGDGALTQVSLDYTTYGTTCTSTGAFSFAAMPNTDLNYFGALLKMEQFVYVDPVTQYQTILDFAPFPITLPPGEETELGDVYAN